MSGNGSIERLKAETMDLLCGNHPCWMPFDEIACVHEDCDGDVDLCSLREVLTELVAEGEVEHDRQEDEYRWVEKKATGDDWTESDRGKAVRAVDVPTGKDEAHGDIHAQLAVVRKELAEVRESLGEAVTLLGRLVAMAESAEGDGQ